MFRQKPDPTRTALEASRRHDGEPPNPRIQPEAAAEAQAAQWRELDRWMAARSAPGGAPDVRRAVLARVQAGQAQPAWWSLRGWCHPQSLGTPAWGLAGVLTGLFLLMLAAPPTGGSQPSQADREMDLVTSMLMPDDLAMMVELPAHRGPEEQP